MELNIGSKIGDYEVVDILGVGGMGKVYKVRNKLSDRVEAMKVLLPNLAANPELADRFMREIKVQASLDHPNIAQLHTALHVDNQLLMLMEFVDGVSLEQKLKSGPLPVPVAVDAIMQTLSALEYAHSRGLVHRDVKPANIMITPSGLVKLMDFGIAKGGGDQQLTMTGTTLGSLYYMSPEQIQGAQDLDARADLYSVGITLYELVTGKRPFDGDSQFAIMSAHLDKPPVPPIEVDPSLPPMLNDIILLAVAKDPGARFQGAGAMRTALSNVLPGNASVAAPPPVATAIPMPQAPPQTATVAAPIFSVPPPPPMTAPGGPPLSANFAQSMMPPPPPPPPPMQQSNGGRGLWMALGALVFVAVAGGLVYFAPWKALTASKTNEAQQAADVSTATLIHGGAGSPTAAPTPVPTPVPTPSPTPTPDPIPAQPVVTQAAAPGAIAPARTAVAPVPQTRPSKPAARTAAAPNPYPMTPEPVQQPAAVAQQQMPPPEPAGPSRAEMMAAREHIAKLGARASGIQGSLSSLERSQQSMGMNMSSKFTGPRDLMNTYMRGAQDALNANDPASAKEMADKAERQIEILEKLLNR